MENPHGFTTAPIHPRTRRGHTAQAKERRKESRERPRATGPMCPLYYQYIFFTHLGLKLSTPELSADKPPVKDASGYCPSIYRVIYTFRYWENRCQNQGTQQRVPKELRPACPGRAIKNKKGVPNVGISPYRGLQVLYHIFGDMSREPIGIRALI